MYKIFENKFLMSWISIIISVATLVYTIVNNYYCNKRIKKNEEINEENRQTDILIRNFINKLNNRVSIFPCFNLVLKNDRIKRGDGTLVLEIGLINIGKESARNIQLSIEDDYKGYFYSASNRHYGIYEYLSETYATIGKEITFKIKVDLKNGEEINDNLKFKIKYSDLIGNVYKQKFSFDVYTLNFIIEYSKKNSTGKPELFEEEDN